MTDSAHLDKVAEAIWQADHPTWTSPKHWPWEKVDPTRQDDYRRMAQAAIDALQLTEERRWWGIDRDKHYQRRWVSGWVRVDGGDA